MVTLLAAEKKRLLAEKGHVTRQDFETAWDACWEVMKKEHAWAHATWDRRSWRRAQKRTKKEFKAAFVGDPTPFAFAAGRIDTAARNACLCLEPEQIGRAMLAAVSYVEIDDEETAERASTAASAFVWMTDEGQESIPA
jgi:hypothetical protein